MACENVAADIIVSGRVQGVGYRSFSERAALDHSIKGWSMNLPDGRVMLDIEGVKKNAELFLEDLKKGPRMSHVTDITVTWKPFLGRFHNFFIKI